MRKWLILFSCFMVNIACSDTFDQQLLMAMKAYKTPVIGYAIIDRYRVVRVETLSIDPTIQVSTNTLFQAASISKSMTAYAILKLIDENHLTLDVPANHYLQHWKIPDNLFTKNHPVIIRQLMDMTSGLSVSGFAGYEQSTNLPTQLELLKGESPANNAPVRVFYTPGSRYFYSGGAFQVLQQVIESITNIDFSTYMNTHVLPIIGMKHSIYQYLLVDAAFKKLVAPGFTGWDGSKITGGWHNYACAGAGGLWSTPSDLAIFILNISASYLGKENAYLSKAMAQQMLTRQKNTDYGLGVVVMGQGKNMYFMKDGHNYGYHSQIIMFPNQGKGIAIMTNSETGDSMINYAIALVAQQYQWPYYFPFFDELVKMPAF